MLNKNLICDRRVLDYAIKSNLCDGINFNLNLMMKMYLYMLKNIEADELFEKRKINIFDIYTKNPDDFHWEYNEEDIKLAKQILYEGMLFPLTVFEKGITYKDSLNSTSQYCCFDGNHRIQAFKKYLKIKKAERYLIDVFMVEKNCRYLSKKLSNEILYSNCRVKNLNYYIPIKAFEDIRIQPVHIRKVDDDISEVIINNYIEAYRAFIYFAILLTPVVALFDRLNKDSFVKVLKKNNIKILGEIDNNLNFNRSCYYGY